MGYKVGQIWICKSMNMKFVITYCDDECFCIIDEDGYASSCCISLDDTCELIIEYPTWEEAINSYEFKNHIVRN